MKVWVALAFACLLLGCRLPLRVSYSPGTVVLDMQKLGEYPSGVARIRVTDLTSRHIVWEIVGRNQPQVGTVTLRLGENAVQPTDIRHGEYQVIAPLGENHFRLTSGVQYEVEVWRSLSESEPNRRVEIAIRS